MNKKLLLIICIVGIVSGLSYVLWGGLEQNMVYFVTPTELHAKGEKAVGNPVRLGGVVEPGTISWKENTLTFQITDHQQTFPVTTKKTPPQMFQDSMGVVVEGSLQANGVFDAERLMVKHGNEYRPPEEGEMPQEIYRELKAQ